MTLAHTYKRADTRTHTHNKTGRVRVSYKGRTYMLVVVDGNASTVFGRPHRQRDARPYGKWSSAYVDTVTRRTLVAHYNNAHARIAAHVDTHARTALNNNAQDNAHAHPCGALCICCAQCNAQRVDASTCNATRNNNATRADDMT